ncbi:hypothetical protein AHAS_Ahas07G0076000 [Arachis hypogaea]
MGDLLHGRPSATVAHGNDGKATAKLARETFRLQRLTMATAWLVLATERGERARAWLKRWRGR